MTTRVEEIDLRLNTLSTQATAEALERATNAERKTEEERLERVRLESQIAPRRLTLDQKKRIGKACLGLSGKPILVRSYQLDPEGYVLGDEIASILNASGFNVIPQLGFVQSSGQPDTGVHVRSPANEIALASCLRDALSNVGKLEVDLNGPRHELDSIVGGGLTAMNGNETMLPAGPLPPGSPVTIMVGIKPPTELKKTLPSKALALSRQV